MENTLQPCLPHIRFFCLSSKEFLQKVHPYKKLLRHQFYEELLNSYLDPDSEPTDNISLPRNILIDSKIVNILMVSHISKWIDKKVIISINNFAQIRELYLPYKFELLLRGSRDGFTPTKFHTLCDNIPNTVTFIKVKGTEEIIGGYNPIIWKSSNDWGETSDSFIFSFKNKHIPIFKDAIISNVNNTSRAINHRCIYGPYFGHDLVIISYNKAKEYEKILCNKSSYKKEIRDINDQFLIKDYEVYQIIRK